MRKSLKHISLTLLLAGYFLAANGMVLEAAARWYSTGSEHAIAFQGGAAKDLPVPSLTQRAYTPLSFSVVVLPTGLPASPFIYPAEKSYALFRFEQALPSYTAELFSTLADRAPPAA